MKVLIYASLLVVAVSASLLGEQEAQFQAFKLKHGKTYFNKAEEVERFSIFRRNLRSIEKHNARYEQGLETYKQGVNQFADMTEDEFEAMLKLSYSHKPHFNTTKHVKTGLKIPSSVDWRNDGQVTGVKDQGNCGSCWAFSVTGSTEAAYKRKTGKLVSLSEQQLVSCTIDSIGGINSGCQGGALDETFPYIEQYGLESESSYPYTGVNGTCKYNSKAVVTKVDDFVSVTSYDEDALLEAVGSVGPVSVAIDALFLRFYFTGIFSGACSETLNHGVMIVGYGTENGLDYWLIKNSWAASFGENGYFRIIRGKNECGVAIDAVYPIIN